MLKILPHAKIFTANVGVGAGAEAYRSGEGERLLKKLPINPKRIAMVRDLRMLEAEDWPDDMSREKFGHFCMMTGFPVQFFRQGDPPEFAIHFCFGSNYETEIAE